MDFSLSKEQMDIKKAAGEFARGEFKPEIAQECELNHRFPRELYQKAGELGFIGLDYPEELGGGGMGVLENVLVVEEFCKVDSGIGMAIHLACLRTVPLAAPLRRIFRFLLQCDVTAVAVGNGATVLREIPFLPPITFFPARSA